MQGCKIQLKELATGYLARSSLRYCLHRRGQGNRTAVYEVLIIPLSAAGRNPQNSCLLKLKTCILVFRIVTEKLFYFSLSFAADFFGSRLDRIVLGEEGYSRP